MNTQTLAEQQAALRSKAEQLEHERAEVAAHYEHDPEVFSLVLDSQLTYSTGIFTAPGDDWRRPSDGSSNSWRGTWTFGPGRLSSTWAAGGAAICCTWPSTLRGIVMESHSARASARRP